MNLTNALEVLKAGGGRITRPGYDYQLILQQNTAMILAEGRWVPQKFLVVINSSEDCFLVNNAPYALSDSELDAEDWSEAK